MGTAAIGLCVALLIVVTSLFNGFIDTFEAYCRRDGEVIILPRYGISDFEGLSQCLEGFGSIDTAKCNVYTAGLLYMGRGDVRGVGLTGIDLPRKCRSEQFRKGLLIQGDGVDVPTFELSDRQKQLARKWMEKKFRRKVTDDELPVGAIVGIGLMAKPDELTDEYDRRAIIQQLRDRKEPMVITTGRLNQDDSGRTAGKKRLLCWPIDVVQTGHHRHDSDNVCLPLECVKELAGAVGPDEKIYSLVYVEVTGKVGCDAETVKTDAGLGWRKFAREKLNWPVERIAAVSIEDVSESEFYRIVAHEIRKQLGIMQSILGLICVVAALLIFVILLMIVMQKKKDIGIIRAVGASRGSVAGIFLWYGGGIGAAGTIIGVALGVWATRNINLVEGWLTKILGFKIWKSSAYMFSHIPDKVDWSSLVWIVLIGLITATAGAVIPAWRAARLQPIESLRYE